MNITEVIISTVGIIGEESLNVFNEGSHLSFYIFFFALIGFISIVSTVIRSGGKGLASLISLVALPVMFVVSISNKKKRKQRLEEWGEIRKGLTTKKHRKRLIFYLILKISIPIAIAIWALFEVLSFI